MSDDSIDIGEAKMIAVDEDWLAEADAAADATGNGPGTAAVDAEGSLAGIGAEVAGVTEMAYGVDVPSDVWRIDRRGAALPGTMNAEAIDRAYWLNIAVPTLRAAVDRSPTDQARELLDGFDDATITEMVRLWLTERRRLFVGVSHTSGQNVFHVTREGNVQRLAGVVEGQAGLLRHLLYGDPLPEHNENGYFESSDN